MTIVTATVTASVAPAIGTGTAIRGATARNANGSTSDTCRANPSARTGTATTVSERVIRNEGHPHKQGGCETYKDTTHTRRTPKALKSQDGLAYACSMLNDCCRRYAAIALAATASVLFFPLSVQ